MPGPGGGNERGSSAISTQFSTGNGERPGTIIAAFVRARLLGIQILTLDARVALVPADRPGDLPVIAGRAQSRTVSSRERNPNGQRADLADAVRLLDEGTKALEQVRGVGIL